MNRLGLAFAVILLACAAIILASRGVNAHQGDDSGSGAQKAKASQAVGAKSERDHKKPRTGVATTTRLRALLTSELASAPAFEEVDALCAALTDAELQVLIAEIGMASEQGLEGWVRNALFAEWGRRDPLAALDFLSDPPFEKVAGWASEQAHFAIYRAWAEKDAAAAAASLALFTPGASEGASGRQWLPYACTEIYSRFARQDPESAWRSIAGRPDREAAMEGLFRGLGDATQLRDYIGRWVGDWTSEAGRKAYEEYKRKSDSPLSSFVRVPPDEAIARSAALAMARFDLEEAEAWLRENGPGDDQMRSHRRSTLFSDWAAANPQRALTHLDLVSPDEHDESLASGIIAGDPALAVGVMRIIDNHDGRARILGNGAPGLGSSHVMDFFPTPGGRNRLPNFEERYRLMLHAVEAGRFEEGQRRMLLRFTHQIFENVVPAAVAALAAEAVTE